MGRAMLRQILYVSSSSLADKKIDVDRIFESSRHNNSLDGVTGLLLSDGWRFVQVLEGSPDGVEATMERIRRDPRHVGVTVLHDGPVEAREFGGWSMADRRRGERTDEFDARLERMLRRASPAVRDAFVDLVDGRRAA